MTPTDKKVKKVKGHEKKDSSMRVAAEKTLSNSRETSPDLEGQSPEQLIHELEVHQIELETQGEELRRIQHELEKSRYQYIDLYEFAPLGYLSLNDKTFVTKANLTAANLLGVERNNLINHGFGLFIDPEYLETWDQYFLTLCRDAGKQVINLTIRRGDGSTFPARLEGTRFYPDISSVILHVMISDISDITTSQKDLHTSRSRLELAMEAGKLAWWEMDCSTGKVSFSEQKALMLGYQAEKFSHFSDFTSLLHPDDYEPTMQAMRDHLSGVKKNYEADYRIRTVTGEYRWFHDTGGISAYGTDGAPLLVSGLVMDITERKQADLALRESEEKFRQLFTHMPAAVAIYVPTLDGSDFIFKDFNTAAEAIEGIKKCDLVGKRVSEVFPGVTKFGLFEVLKRVCKTGVAEYYPAALYRDNRDPGTWRENWIYKLASGEIIVIYHDITERKREEELLQKTTQLLNETQEITNLGGWEYEVASGHITWTDEVYRIHGVGHDYDPNNVTNDLGFYVPEDAPVIERAFNRLIHQGEPYDLEARLLRGDGRIIQVRTMGKPVMVDGRIIRVHGNIIDITDRKRVEDALRESEERYRGLINGVPDYILVHRNGKILFVNPAALKVIGDNREDLVGSDIMNYIAPESRPLVVAMMAKISANEVIPPYEITIIPRSGVKRFTEVHGALIIYLGEPASLNVLSDITERKRAEEALRESEERYRALLFGAGIGVGYWSTEGNLLFLNEISLTRLMVKEGDYMGKNMREIFGDDAGKYLERIRVSALSSEPMEYEDHIRLPCGKGWYLSVYSRITGMDGSVKGVQVLSMDITDRKYVEEMRERLLIDLKQKNAELEQFTYTVSHDLKSPLITIKGFLGYLEKDALSGDATRLHDDIARIHTATSKMEEFISALLELSRIGRVVNPPVSVSLAFLVLEAVEALHAEIDQRGIQLIIPGDLPEVYGDKVRLQQVMTNLIGNAVKFMGDQKEPGIEISASHNEGEVHICVQDNGIGIAPENLDKIFSVFTRLNPSIPGAGIGLSLVKRIIEVHGGQCSVESQGLGKGSRFCFSLPDMPRKGEKKEVEEQ